VTLAPVHDDATIDEAVAALARELGGYLIAADAGLGSVPLEVRVTRRWREPDSNHRSRARVVSVLLLRDQMLLASAWIPTSLWGATREIGLYSATASAPLVLKRADRPWAHTVIEKPMSAVVFRAPPVGFEMRLEPTTADGAFR